MIHINLEQNIRGTLGILLPVGVMSGAEWNILDASGSRIAICGTDGNHEKDGILIAKEIVDIINSKHHKCESK